MSIYDNQIKFDEHLAPQNQCKIMSKCSGQIDEKGPQTHEERTFGRCAHYNAKRREMTRSNVKWDYWVGGIASLQDISSMNAFARTILNLKSKVLACAAAWTA